MRRVAYDVQPARGQRSDYDKLTLHIHTNGSIDARAALREAAEMLIAQLAIFTDADRYHQPRDSAQLEGSHGHAAAHVDASARATHDRRIEELGLGVRSYNCLRRVGIQTIGSLVTKSRQDLNAIPSLGQKSIDEIIDTLRDFGLALREHQP
ncbi:MAG: DNA-directed polymerase subunit alpha [Solirubrobacteraceae bacterium]|nr:DNA-directed polymerase subunit alpha [Solirubrobacteraceae bacterium]